MDSKYKVSVVMDKENKIAAIVNKSFEMEGLISFGAVPFRRKYSNLNTYKYSALNSLSYSVIEYAGNNFYTNNLKPIKVVV